MVWDANAKVPRFSAIPACPRQDPESPDDVLSGRVQRRVLNIPATGADCSNDGGKGALELARTRMDSIATKIRTRAALTAEERQFVANVSTLRSEEHTSELQSLMRISYAVFCLKKKKKKQHRNAKHKNVE